MVVVVLLDLMNPIRGILSVETWFFQRRRGRASATRPNGDCVTDGKNDQLCMGVPTSWWSGGSFALIVVRAAKSLARVSSCFLFAAMEGGKIKVT